MKVPKSSLQRKGWKKTQQSILCVRIRSVGFNQLVTELSHPPSPTQSRPCFRITSGIKCHLSTCLSGVKESCEETTGTMFSFNDVTRFPRTSHGRPVGIGSRCTVVLDITRFTLLRGMTDIPFLSIVERLCGLLVQ